MNRSVSFWFFLARASSSRLISEAVISLAGFICGAAPPPSRSVRRRGQAWRRRPAARSRGGSPSCLAGVVGGDRAAGFACGKSRTAFGFELIFVARKTILDGFLGFDF